MDINYCTMSINHYNEMYDLWKSIPEMNLNTADEREKIDAYLLRNPGQSFICKADGHVAGTIMCGNDGRRAFIYHLAVSADNRNKGIAAELVRLALNKQKTLGMDKCAIFILHENISGKKFWEHLGFAVVQEAGTMAKSI